MNQPDRLAVELTVFPRSSPHDRCPVCHRDVDVHQPDQTTPERLLATCIHCKAWFLIDEAADSMTLLPG
jgi:hypothetical protein